MMVSSRLRHLVFFFLASVGLLCSCDTAKNIEDPTKNYFIKYYGGDGDQEGVDAVVGKDGFIYLLGNTNTPTSTNGKQLYLVKADADGKLVWEKTFGGKFDEEAKDLEITTDDRLVILANSQKGFVDSDILVMTVSLEGVKIDSVLIGLKTISGAEADDNASSVSQTADGFIVSGSTTGVSVKPNQGSEDVRDALHLRFTSNLTIFNNTVWKNVSGSIGSDGATRVHQVNSGTYYVFGYTNIDVTGTSTIDFNFWVYQLGATGEANNSKMYPGAPVTNEKLTSVIASPLSSGDGFLLAGTSSNAVGSYDIYITKLRKTLTFNQALDYQINNTLSQLNQPQSVTLGKLDIEKGNVSVFSSIYSGYLVLANEKSATTNNFYLTKINIDGGFAWDNPENLIFGGQRDDFIGAVLELADGKIILIGTMAIGDEGQKKMALIKLNKEGKFLD